MSMRSFFIAFATAIIVFSTWGNCEAKGETLTIKHYKDSVQTEIGETSCGVYITIEYPENANEELKNSINKWMTIMVGGTPDTELPNANLIMKAYINNSMAELRKMVRENEKEGSYMPLGYYLDIKKVYEDNNIITLDADIYINNGGPHGKSSYIGTTFNKKDGYIFGDNMLNKNFQREIRKKIERGLFPHFEAENTKELYSRLMLKKGVTLVPMPETPPYIIEDKIVFLYQQYEIAPYVADKPEARIPIKELMPYLSAEFKQVYSTSLEK